MDKKIKEQWVKDLRSGDFPQTTSCLKNEEGFCCYGVLAERAVEAGILVRNQREDGRYYYASAANPIDFYDEILPVAAAIWAELEEQNPFVGTGSDRMALTELNDSNTPFDVIADVIEKYL